MRTLCVFLFASGLAVAQLDQDTITVVSNAIPSTPPPGMVAVDVNVLAAVGTGLEEILSALAPVGMSERDLTSFNSPVLSICPPGDRQCSPPLAWEFRFTAPLASLPETLAKLARAAAGAKAGISISYLVSSAASSGSPDCA